MCVSRTKALLCRNTRSDCILCVEDLLNQQSKAIFRGRAIPACRKQSIEWAPSSNGRTIPSKGLHHEMDLTFDDMYG
jgi:hypothetical protein